MTISQRIDPIAAQIAPIVSRVIVEEARKAGRQLRQDADAEIMAAAQEVGSALDLLLRARFAGQEARYQKKLETAARRLQRVMK